MRRRDALALFSAPALAASTEAIVVDPAPLHPLSPYLYMQFMEPLGVTDGSVEACWDYERDDWREDFVNVTRDLAPGVLRWGGLFSRYYKWREGVGPAARRPLMRNYVWGGRETNRVGTAEFVDLCRRTGAAPLICVNFLSDGQQRFRGTREGDRSGDAREAAGWVSYANDPSNRDRRAHGSAEPYNIRLWQLGNETSYGRECFRKQEAIAKTIEFAKAMRERDPSVQLIGWGDRDPIDRSLWAGDMLREAGEYLSFIAIHMMQQRPVRKDTILRGRSYQQDPARAWDELMEMSRAVDGRLVELEQVLGRSRIGVAVTEGHLSLRPHNANQILTEWLTGVYHARAMNTYERHGERVKIATGADFAGTRWTVNAVLLPVPGGQSYLTPVGAVMRLFGRNRGAEAIAVKSAPADLDIAASRTDNRIWLHVANTAFARSCPATFAVSGRTIVRATVHEIAPEDVRTAPSPEEPNALAPRLNPVIGATWRFPAASVSVVELEVR
ncbi:MAG TPA: alpha-L-arabinofuranosidase C-terminal domain-containing protein [Bryobacteraceae bacterium]|nr:alpha-L-arabinofuranosidase C-terminal domain-containing protein [Bryobacteraceae bacterium]